MLISTVYIFKRNVKSWQTCCCRDILEKLKTKNLNVKPGILHFSLVNFLCDIK